MTEYRNNRGQRVAVAADEWGFPVIRTFGIEGGFCDGYRIYFTVEETQALLDKIAKKRGWSEEEEVE